MNYQTPTSTPVHQYTNTSKLLQFISIVSLLTILFSCDISEVLPGNENTNSWKTSEIEVADGTLHFKNYAVVNNYLTRFSKMTEEQIIELENSMNFVSFRSAMNRSAVEFDEVITKEEFEKWRERYSDILFMQGDEVTSRIPVFSYEIITNREREYFVGEAFHKVTADKVIIILDGDKSKLPQALTLNSSSPEQKILINLPQRTYHKYS